MANFPRDIASARATGFLFPGALISPGQSGKIQTRSVASVGRSWVETWASINLGDPDVKKLLAFINQSWRNGDSFDLYHPDYRSPNGAGGGSPEIKGADQTGISLLTDGWPNSTLVLKAGDLFVVENFPYALDVMADVTSDGSGNATISISPPIFTGNSPDDNADITVDDPLMTCIIATVPNVPESNPGDVFNGLQIAFVEVL